MIKVNRLNNEEFWINCDHIEFLEATPDTIISLQSGRKVVVSQSVEEIMELIAGYKKKIFSDAP